MSHNIRILKFAQGVPGGSVVKNLPANAEDMGSVPGSGRSPGEENGNRLQYSCLENSMDCIVYWVARRNGKGNGNLLQYSCLENPMDREAW